jgi:hypothetical protein
MKILSTAKEHPIASGAWIAGAVAFLTMLPKVDDGLKLLYRKWNADNVAAAAEETATGVRNDFTEYIRQEREEAIRDQALLQAQQTFNQQLLQLQQQQTQAQGIYQQDVNGIWWHCPISDPQACSQQGLWRQWN